VSDGSHESLFQKIKAPVDGRVVEIVAENEKPVANNNVLLVLETDWKPR
jgi:biotin carboxyl carrier protein